MAWIKWLGHSVFELDIDGKRILIDPFISDNPACPVGVEDIKADIVCVTHDHHDHLGDSIEICKRTGATFVGAFELGVYAESEGVKDVVAMNIGATLGVKGVEVTMVPAFHSSTRGPSVGFVVGIGDLRVYHAGDTGLFSDMKLIAELYKPRVACFPIGGYYTMGPREAAEAAQLVSPQLVFPMHYRTFPVLEQTADGFLEFMRKLGLEKRVVVLEPGQAYEL
jgi:L-ascorbate metabolism protein UlaG (beta-lactamase superfamily)